MQGEVDYIPFGGHPSRPFVRTKTFLDVNCAEGGPERRLHGHGQAARPRLPERDVEACPLQLPDQDDGADARARRHRLRSTGRSPLAAEVFRIQTCISLIAQRGVEGAGDCVPAEDVQRDTLETLRERTSCSSASIAARPNPWPRADWSMLTS